MATLRELAQTLLRTAPGSEEETTVMMQMCEHCAEVTSVAESGRMQQLQTQCFGHALMVKDQ